MAGSVFRRRRGPVSEGREGFDGGGTAAASVSDRVMSDAVSGSENCGRDDTSMRSSGLTVDTDSVWLPALSTLQNSHSNNYIDLEQSANGFEGPVADSWTILQPAKDRNVHSQLLYTLAQSS